MRKMSKSKTDAPKKSLLRRVRRQRLKYITILPSLITILNGVFGFTAIIFAGKGLDVLSVDSKIPFFTFGSTTYFAMSGYMILVAMIADMLDGRLARRMQGTSSFGGQLDSLCDIISFGVAPAYLMLNVLESVVADIGLADERFLQRFIWITAAAYISCAAIRLARFNVENEEDESAHMSFMGLPTPAAAGVIVSLVIFHQEKLPKLAITNFAIIGLLPFIALGISILMVSRIRYPHILNQYLRGKKPFAHLIRILLLLIFVFVSIQAALVVTFCVFAANSFLRWLYYRISASRFFAGLRHKVIPDKDNLVPAAQHSVSIAIDEAKVDE
ncbi:MAG: CDP-alcohol phosphatidyltransferase family protein [Sedimentisphaerales bacterium]|nr:CDP-alcohol phosphatidyltransferase family protein [Sedimentisphaerales bacterium]